MLFTIVSLSGLTARMLTMPFVAEQYGLGVSTELDACI